MTAKRKKFTALFLVLSLLALSGNLYAKKKGAELVIQKIEGREVRGELIAVRQDTLLLKRAYTGADTTVNISEVRMIRIKKKSKMGGGAVWGLLIGATIGGLAGSMTWEPKDEERFMGADRGTATGYGAAIGGLLGLLLGATAGQERGIDEKIQIEGRTDAEIKEVLVKLRKRARIPDSQ